MPFEAGGTESFDLLVAALLSADPGGTIRGDTAMVKKWPIRIYVSKHNMSRGSC